MLNISSTLLQEHSNKIPAATSGFEVNEPILASFVVCAYNQERFIHEAVEGAFAQRYTPLEIILSDDCSTDSTFEIMRALTSKYQGRHAIHLNRNENNLGLAEHVNKVCRLINGSVLVGAAGDDISLPERTDRTVAEFDNKPSVFIVKTGFSQVSSDGSLLPDFPFYELDYSLGRRERLLEIAAGRYGGVQGCCTSYRREVFDRFDPLPKECHAEDILLYFRGLLLGDLVTVPERLVKYRQHSTALSNSPDPGGRRSFLQNERLSRRIRHGSIATYSKALDEINNCLKADQFFLDSATGRMLTKRLNTVVTSLQERLRFESLDMSGRACHFICYPHAFSKWKAKLFLAENIMPLLKNNNNEE